MSARVVYYWFQGFGYISHFGCFGRNKKNSAKIEGWSVPVSAFRQKIPYRSTPANMVQYLWHEYRDWVHSFPCRILLPERGGDEHHEGEDDLDEVFEDVLSRSQFSPEGPRALELLPGVRQRGGLSGWAFHRARKSHVIDRNEFHGTHWVGKVQTLMASISIQVWY